MMLSLQGIESNTDTQQKIHSPLKSFGFVETQEIYKNFGLLFSEPQKALS